MRLKISLISVFCIFLISLILFPTPLFANSVPDRSHSYLSVSSSVPADGKTTAIITVTLQDSSGNPVVGNSVALEDSTNSGATITTLSGTTDGSGHALFSIKSTKSQTDTLNVTDVSANVKFYNLGEITFTAEGCFDSSPGSTPRLVSAIANGSAQITLNWTSASNPVTRYLVSYGVSSGQYIYGNPDVGGQGTTSYTIGSLSLGKRYYFVVQAINGCTPGNFSNEISAVAGISDNNTPPSTPPLNSPKETDTGNDVAPTGIPSQNDTMPTITSHLMQQMEPVLTETPPPTPPSDSPNTNMPVLISIGILVMGSIGNFLYWKHKKREMESMRPTEEV